MMSVYSSVQVHVGVERQTLWSSATSGHLPKLIGVGVRLQLLHLHTNPHTSHRELHSYGGGVRREWEAQGQKSIFMINKQLKQITTPE